MLTMDGVTVTKEVEPLESRTLTPPEPAGWLRVRLPVSVVPVLMVELGSDRASAGVNGETTLNTVLTALAKPLLLAVRV
jgi:hypothetical protein